MNEHVITHCEERILTIELRRPDKKNALTAGMYSAIDSALAEATSDKGIRVVFLRGQADCFTAGNDIADFVNNPTSGAGPAALFIERLVGFQKPVVAAVAGPAIGIGTTLLLHCDLVFAAADAKFSLPFVNLGLCPEAGSSLLLGRIVGEKRAAKLMLLGDTFSAAVANEVGIVTEVCQADILMSRAFETAAELARKPARALCETKSLIRGDLSVIRERIKIEGNLFRELLRSESAQEAMNAFRERRKPDFSTLDG